VYFHIRKDYVDLSDQDPTSLSTPPVLPTCVRSPDVSVSMISFELGLRRNRKLIGECLDISRVVRMLIYIQER
jgi:hypothetical protein